MELKYIDNHCHLNFPDYEADLDAVISRARDAGVGMVVVGTHRESSARAVEIAEKYEGIWAIVGLHPVYAKTEVDACGGVFDIDFYRGLAKHPKVVGIGECGYDFFRTDGSEEDHAIQDDVFRKQITIANEFKKPLMLHLRNGKNSKSAYGMALEVLKKEAKVAGDTHFYAGTLEEAQEFLALGFNISFTGVITFARNYDHIIRQIPLDRIMSETDAPYVTPEPHRGERNEPSFVTEVVKKIAEIRGEDLDVVSMQLVENSNRLWSISR